MTHEPQKITTITTIDQQRRASETATEKQNREIADRIKSLNTLLRMFDVGGQIIHVLPDRGAAYSAKREARRFPYRYTNAAYPRFFKDLPSAEHWVHTLISGDHK